MTRRERTPEEIDRYLKDHFHRSRNRRFWSYRRYRAALMEYIAWYNFAERRHTEESALTWLLRHVARIGIVASMIGAMTFAAIHQPRIHVEPFGSVRTIQAHLIGYDVEESEAAKWHPTLYKWITKNGKKISVKTSKKERSLERIHHFLKITTKSQRKEAHPHVNTSNRKTGQHHTGYGRTVSSAV